MDEHTRYIHIIILGPKTTCSIIHPHTSCISEIFNKCQQVVAASSKLYALLYIAMFLMRFRKIRSQGKIQKTILLWSKDYLWSLAFMSWTVGGMKSALCLLNTLGSPLDGTHISQHRSHYPLSINNGLAFHLHVIEIKKI